MHIELVGKPIFGIAGLWDRWRQPDGQALQSVTLITVPANDMMSTIHDRMPAILRRDDEDAWLDPTFTDPYGIVSLLRPFEASQMRAYKVSPIVNKPGVEGSECIAPLTDEDEPSQVQIALEL